MLGEGAALCYRTICTEGAARFGPHAHPEVSMHTPSLAEYMEPIYRGDWEAVGSLMCAKPAVMREVDDRSSSLHQPDENVMVRSSSRKRRGG